MTVKLSHYASKTDTGYKVVLHSILRESIILFRQVLALDMESAALYGKFLLMRVN